MAEPPASSGFVSSLVEGKIYVWGGSSRKTSSVYTFDPYLETWATLKTDGSPPSGICYGACACAGHHMYTYGGWGDCHDGSLHSLNTRTLTWTKLASSGPMRKTHSRMISYSNKLLLCGGHGAGSSSSTQPGSEFILDIGRKDRSGWTNELHEFDLREGEDVQEAMPSIVLL